MPNDSETSALTLIADSKVVSEQFDLWRKSLLEESTLSGKIWRISSERMVFSNYDNELRGVLGKKVALGLDPQGEDWAVQINEPKVAGSENSTSGIGQNATGRYFLLRQGRLRPNNQSPKEIVGKEFSDRTDLVPTSVIVGGKKATRDWYVVTPLDLDTTSIRRNTANFVNRCSYARTGPIEEAISDSKRLIELFGAPERGGQSEVTRTAWDGKALREQGEVWLRLRDYLQSYDIKLLKPKHACGYEVDGEIRRDVDPILVEIKTGNSAAEIYTAVGQLHIYPNLLPRLRNHARILLIPQPPSSALVDAIQACGIEIYTYKIIRTDDEITEIIFQQAFLHRCGAITIS